MANRASERMAYQKITDIKIDRRKPSEERILAFLMKTKNPYIFKVNEKLVRIRFLENSSLSAEDCLTNILKNLYKQERGINI